MTIRKSVLVLTVGLFAVVMVFHAGTSLAATETLNQKQLQLLFTGSSLHATGGLECQVGVQVWRGGGLWDFRLKENGEFKLVFECHAGGYTDTEESTGRWWIDGDRLCMEEKGSIFSRFSEKSPDNCWWIEAGNTYFVARDSFNREIWNFEVFNSALPTGLNA